MAFTIERTDTTDGSVIKAEHDVEVDWSDQTGWFDPERCTSSVTIIGCGGIGSNVAFELITMGFRRFVLYDDDAVEQRNLASQKAYRHSDLYKKKTEALAQVLIEYGATEVTIHSRRFVADDEIDSPIVIGAVDSMASRKTIWEAVENSPDVEMYLDGRLEGEIAQIFAVDPYSADWYTTSWLFSDEEASNVGTCTMRAIVYPATIMASVMCRHLSLWFRGKPVCRFVQADMVNLEFTKMGDFEEE